MLRRFETYIRKAAEKINNFSAVILTRHYCWTRSWNQLLLFEESPQPQMGKAQERRGQIQSATFDAANHRVFAITKGLGTCLRRITWCYLSQGTADSVYWGIDIVTMVSLIHCLSKYIAWCNCDKKRKFGKIHKCCNMLRGETSFCSILFTSYNVILWFERSHVSVTYVQGTWWV